MSVSSVYEFIVNHSFLLNSDSSRNYDKEFINEIKKIQCQLGDLLKFYKIRDKNNNDNDKTKNSNINEFINSLSVFLNLSYDVSKNLFQGYLLTDGKLDEADLTTMISRGFNTKTLLQKIKHFYQAERLNLIRVIKYVFCEWNEEQMILSKIIFGVSKFSDKQSIYLSLLQSYNDFSNILAKNIPNILEESDETIKSLLDEEIELLEALLLGSNFLKYVDDYNIIDVFTKTMDVFKKTNFSSESTLSKVFTNKTTYKKYLERNNFIQTLTVINLSRTNQLFNGDINNNSEFNKCFREISSMLATASRKLNANRSSDSILMLYTSLLGVILPPNENSNAGDVFQHHIISSMADVSINKLGVFRYMESVISTNSYYTVSEKEGNYVGVIVHCTLFEMVTLLFHNVHLASLDSSIRSDVLTLMTKLVGPVIKYSRNQPMNKGFIQFLEDLSMSFPCDLGMGKMLACLIDTNENHESIISMVGKFMENLQWFSEELNAIDDQLFEVIDEDCQRVQLKMNYSPYNTNIFSFNSGLEGFICENRVIWAVKYQLWHILEWEFNSIVANFHSFKHITRLITLIELSTSCINNNIGIEPVLAMLSSLIPLLESNIDFGKCELYETLFYQSIKLISTSVNTCVNKGDNRTANKILASLQNLLPLVNVTSLSAEFQCNENALFALFTVNMSSTKSQIIIEYLQFCSLLLRLEKDCKSMKELVPPQLLYGCLVFVTRELIPALSQIQFPSNKQPSEIVSYSQMFLTDILSINIRLYNAPANVIVRLQLLHRICLDCVIRYCLRHILTISCSADNSSNNFSVSSGLALHGTESQISRTARLALTLIDHIFVISSDEEILSISSANNEGAQAILSVLDYTSPNSYCQQYVYKLMSYACDKRYNVKLQRMALLVLRRLVESANGAISLVGCLGESINAIKAILQRYLTSESVDQLLRCQLLELLASSVNTGRRTALQLIGGDSDEWVKALVKLIGDEDTHDSISLSLLKSASKLLLAIWMNDCTASIESFKNNDIWIALSKTGGKFIVELLKDELDTQKLEFISNSLGILCMEMYVTCSNVSEHEEEANSTVGVTNTDILLEYTRMLLFNRSVLALLDKQQLSRAKTTLGAMVHYRASWTGLVLEMVTWWRALLTTVLHHSHSNILGNEANSMVTLCTLSKQLLACCHSLMLAYDSEEDENINTIEDTKDILASSVLNIISAKKDLMTKDQRNELIRAICDLLNTRIIIQQNQHPIISKSDNVDSTNNIHWKMHRRHIDLFAGCVLLSNNLDFNENTADQLVQVAMNYLCKLSTIVHLKRHEEKVLIQVLSCLIMCSDQTNVFELLMARHNFQLINLLSLLEDRLNQSKASGHIDELQLSLLSLMLHLAQHNTTQFTGVLIDNESVLTAIIEHFPCSDRTPRTTLHQYYQLLLHLFNQLAGLHTIERCTQFLSIHWLNIMDFCSNANSTAIIHDMSLIGPLFMLLHTLALLKPSVYHNTVYLAPHVLQQTYQLIRSVVVQTSHEITHQTSSILRQQNTHTTHNVTTATPPSQQHNKRLYRVTFAPDIHTINSTAASTSAGTTQHNYVLATSLIQLVHISLQLYIQLTESGLSEQLLILQEAPQSFNQCPHYPHSYHRSNNRCHILLRNNFSEPNNTIPTAPRNQVSHNYLSFGDVFYFLNSTLPLLKHEMNAGSAQPYVLCSSHNLCMSIVVSQIIRYLSQSRLQISSNVPALSSPYYHHHHHHSQANPIKKIVMDTRSELLAYLSAVNKLSKRYRQGSGNSPNTSITTPPGSSPCNPLGSGYLGSSVSSHRQRCISWGGFLDTSDGGSSKCGLSSVGRATDGFDPDFIRAVDSFRLCLDSL